LAVPADFGARVLRALVVDRVDVVERPVARARLATVFGLALDVAVTICSTTPDVENARHRCIR
jgi:hypothetical protein